MGNVVVNMRLTSITDPPVTVALRALVVTGAVLTLLPQDVVKHLRLRTIGTVIVRLADEQRKEMPKAGPVLIEISGRSGYFDCLVGPPNCEPLVGQLVLEELDLIVDSAQQRVTARPESPFLPLLSLK